MTAAVFLKAPQPGKVKTRLAESLGPEAACKAYRLLVAETLRRLPEHWSKSIFFTPVDAEQEMREWLGTAGFFYPQCAGDLGDRQSDAVARIIKNDSVILLGGDCPYLETARLIEVEKVLADHEAVLIPAADGGYVALALKGFSADLFAGIVWGTDTVARQLKENARQSGLDLVELEPSEDVDTLAEWERARDHFGWKL